MFADFCLENGFVIGGGTDYERQGKASAFMVMNKLQ